MLRFSSPQGRKVSSREGSSLEFKESFNWSSKDVYAKTVAAFANKNGGRLVFGVRNKPRELVGLQSSNFEDIDEAKIAEYLNGLFAPEIEFVKETETIRGRKIGALIIEAGSRKPVVAIKNDGVVKEGEIYYRYNARTDKIKYPAIRFILDKIREDERRQWMDMFQRISRVGPENAALLNLEIGEIQGSGGSVIIDEGLLPKLKFIKEGSFKETGAPTLKLIGDLRAVSFVGQRRQVRGGGGVRWTDDPRAPAVRIEEKNILQKFPLDYSALTKILKERFVDFKVNPRYHQIRQLLMKRGFSVTRVLNPKNPRSSKQDFYSRSIVQEFDKHYQKTG